MALELRNFFTTHPTRPELAKILLSALTLWLSGQPVIIPTASPTYTHLITKQHRAGWDQLLYGRFVLEWAELQEDFLTSLPKRSKYHSGKTWVSGITQIIWKHVYEAWLLRNDAQHGVDTATREIALATMARKQTAALYEIRADVLPRDHSLFYSNIEEHHEREPTSRGINQWLTTWQPVILQSVKEAVRLGTRGMASIQRYFPALPFITPDDDSLPDDNPP
jgi:hypothetical protein